MKLDAEGYKEDLLETQIDIYCNSYGCKELSNTMRGKSKADNKVLFLYEKFKDFLRKKPTKPLSPKPSVDPTLQALEKDEGGVMSAVYTKAVQGMVEKLSPNVLRDLERLYQKYSPKLDYRMIHDACPIEFPEDLPEIAKRLYPGVRFDYTDELEVQSSKKKKKHPVKIECESLGAQWDTENDIYIILFYDIKKPKPAFFGDPDLLRANTVACGTAMGIEEFDDFIIQS